MISRSSHLNSEPESRCQQSSCKCSPTQCPSAKIQVPRTKRRKSHKITPRLKQKQKQKITVRVTECGKGSGAETEPCYKGPNDSGLWADQEATSCSQEAGSKAAKAGACQPCPSKGLAPGTGFHNRGQADFSRQGPKTSTATDAAQKDPKTTHARMRLLSSNKTLLAKTGRGQCAKPVPDKRTQWHSTEMDPKVAP